MGWAPSSSVTAHILNSNLLLRLSCFAVACKVNVTRRGSCAVSFCVWLEFYSESLASTLWHLFRSLGRKTLIKRTDWWKCSAANGERGEGSCWKVLYSQVDSGVGTGHCFFLILNWAIDDKFSFASSRIKSPTLTYLERVWGTGKNELR